MPILAFGLNHRTAAISLRERVAFAEADLPRALGSLRDAGAGVTEAVILSTCNRTEVYCVLGDGADPAVKPDAAAGAVDRAASNGHDIDALAAPVRAWLAGDRGFPAELLHGAVYAHRNGEAARHMMRVASGLDSQVPGEPQIMGQVKTAYEAARRAGTVGAELGPFVETSLRVAKRVRTDTAIGRNPVSVAYAAVALASRIFADMASTRALLIGAGETIELAAEHMRRAGVGSLTVANRTAERAGRLAARFDADAIPLARVPERLAGYDIVISSTASTLPVLGKGAVERAVKARRHRPVFMVDLAVPRDIEPAAGELADVYLYSIDDLTQIIEENLAGREDAAAAAEGIVAEGADAYLRERRVRQGQAVLRRYRDEAQRLRDDVLAAARRRLEAGQEPDRILERLATELTNKLLHKPTVAIREASASADDDVLDSVRRLYKP